MFCIYKCILAVYTFIYVTYISASLHSVLPPVG